MQTTCSLSFLFGLVRAKTGLVLISYRTNLFASRPYREKNRLHAVYERCPVIDLPQPVTSSSSNQNKKKKQLSFICAPKIMK